MTIEQARERLRRAEIRAAKALEAAMQAQNRLSDAEEAVARARTMLKAIAGK